MGKSVNLGIKYEKQIQQQFTLGSLLQGRLENNLDFVGAKTVRVHTIQTVPLQEYDRTASANRYGTPEEVGDLVQELTMTQDMAFSGIIDKGNSSDQAINKAGQFVRVQLDEEVIPEKDRYGLKKLARGAGGVFAGEKIKAENVIDRLESARASFVQARVPVKGRTWFVTSAVCNALGKTDLYRNIASLGGKLMATGQVGEVYGSPVVEVPQDLMPRGVQFMLVHRSAGASPSKIADTKVHIDPPGISGHLVEGRFYWDTFVFGAKCDGIYIDLDSTNVTRLEPPAYDEGTKTFTPAQNAVVRYTTDDSDPRFSMTAREGTTVTESGGFALRFYQYKPEVSNFYASELNEVWVD